MKRQSKFRGLMSLALPLALAGFTGTACNPKERVPSDSEPLEERDAGRPVTPADPAGPGPTAPSPGPGEAPLEVVDLEPGSVVDDQSGVSVSCDSDAGSCLPLGDAGVGPACVPTGPRDCSSDLDNDCDGQPDNVVDDTCVCALGTSEACDEHPDLDGHGPCRAGLRTCVLGADGLTSEWAACEGSVGPGEADSCTVRGDDTDCNGTPNTNCLCVEGETQECGSSTDTGPCAIGTTTCSGGRFGDCIGATPPLAQDSCAPGDDSNCNGRANDRFCACLNGATQQCGITGTGACELGTQTCSNGAFGPCIGARDPGSRDCRSQQDNDCDGRADSALDNVCRCAIGSTQACQTHPNQDGIGRCRAGTQTCAAGAGNTSSNFGACSGSQGPIARDCRSQQDNDCDGRADSALDNVCTCSIGATQACQTHPGLDGIGRCRAGTQTCVAGNNNSSSNFNACTGSVGPRARDCSSAQDNDCDGRPDNTIDSVCECIPGQGSLCSGDANNSRCNAQGQCAPCEADADCSLVSAGRNQCVAGECVPDVLVIGQRIPLSTLEVTAGNVFALATSPGVIRLAKDGSSPAGGDVIFPGSVALAGLSTSGNLVFWNTSTSLIRLGTDGVQSTFASVGISSSLGPVAVAAGSVYWGEQRTVEFTYVRSSATTNTLPAPRTVLRTVTLQEESVEAIAGSGDCVFAVISRNGVDRIDRVCSTQLNSSVYVGTGQLGALAIDASGLYFIEEGVGLRRLAPIDSTTPGTVTVAAGASRGVPSGDFVYFIQNGRSPAGTCGLNASIRRVAKTGGAAEVIEQGPLSCPLGLAVDADFVYWSETAGSVKRSGKDAQ